MNKKNFVSPDGRFSLSLPQNWDQYDDGEDNTFAFFDSQRWSGNLRITPFYWNKLDDEYRNQAAEFIEEELIENPDAVKLKLGDNYCTHYKRDMEQDGNMLVIYYWALGNMDRLFMCSFTIDKDQENNSLDKAVMTTVSEIIKSITSK